MLESRAKGASSRYGPWVPAFAGVSGEYAPPTHDPPIPAHSRPKDGVLSQAEAGIQGEGRELALWPLEKELDPRFRGG